MSRDKTPDQNSLFCLSQYLLDGLHSQFTWFCFIYDCMGINFTLNTIEKIKKNYWILTVSLQLLRCCMVFNFFFLKIVLMDFRCVGTLSTVTIHYRRMSIRVFDPAFSLQNSAGKISFRRLQLGLRNCSRNTVNMKQVEPSILTIHF